MLSDDARGCGSPPSEGSAVCASLGEAGIDALADALEAATGDAVVLTDSVDRIVRWSARAERILGRSASAAIGASASEVLGLPTRAVDAPPRLAQLAAGKPWGASPDAGRSGPQLSWTASPIHDRDGTFRGAVYQGRPRPPPPTATVASAETKQALVARAFDEAFESMAVLDRQRRVLAVNRAFQAAVERAVGHPLELGDDLLGYAAPGSESGFLEGFAGALSGIRSQRARPVRFPNGQEFEHLVEYTPLPEGGEVDAVLFGSLAIDPAGRPVMRRELLERGLAVAPFVILIADARQQGFPIVYASPSLERVTGYRPDEVLGRSARIFQGTLVDQPALVVVRDALANGTSCDVVLQNQRKDGAVFLNRLSLTPVRDDLGTVSHVIGIQEDVTEREQLRAQVREAESQRLSQLMLGGAVHDLRNMLMVAFAAFDSLRDPAPDVALALSSGEEALMRASTLTRLMLRPLTRATSMAGETEIAALCETMRNLARYVLPRTMTLEIDVSPEARTGWVVGSQGGLEQVVLNLLFNARDAMPDGGRIFLSASADPPGGDTIGSFTIAVRDEGPGIADDVLPHVFDPYFTTKASGAGLGLATCQALARAAGGTLRASSTAQGATFHLSLPAARQAGHDSRQRTGSERGIAGLEALVVDVDPSVRGAICALLRRRGALVRDAGDVATARRRGVGLGASALLILGDAGSSPEARGLLMEWLAHDGARSALLSDGGEEAPPSSEGGRVTRLTKPFAYEEMLAAVLRVVRSG